MLPLVAYEMKVKRDLEANKDAEPSDSDGKDGQEQASAAPSPAA